MRAIRAIRQFLWRFPSFRQAIDPGRVHAIRDSQWRQGSILPKALADEVFGYCEPRLHVDSKTQERFFVVVSQDCDVVNRSFEVEPWVEVLVFEKREKKDGNLLRLRNPRQLQILGRQSGNEVVLEANIHHRCRIPRWLLSNGTPDPEIVLPPEQLSWLERWLARRYHRSALPDQFNIRMQDCYSKMKKLLAKNPAAVEQILIALDPWQELVENTSYRLHVVATLRPADYADPAKIRVAEEIAIKLEQMISAVPGIDIESTVEVMSEADISLADLRNYKIWDFESISLSEQ